jgi:hypothetical protein
MKKTLILSIACFLFSCGGGGGSASAPVQQQQQQSSGVSALNGSINDIEVVDID